VVAMFEVPVKKQGQLMVKAVKERGEGGHDRGSERYG
jgi:hypothetical protein